MANSIVKFKGQSSGFISRTAKRASSANRLTRLGASMRSHSQQQQQQLSDLWYRRDSNSMNGDIDEEDEQNDEDGDEFASGGAMEAELMAMHQAAAMAMIAPALRITASKLDRDLSDLARLDRQTKSGGNTADNRSNPASRSHSRRGSITSRGSARSPIEPQSRDEEARFEESLKDRRGTLMNESLYAVRHGDETKMLDLLAKSIMTMSRRSSLLKPQQKPSMPNHRRKQSAGAQDQPLQGKMPEDAHELAMLAIDKLNESQNNSSIADGPVVDSASSSVSDDVGHSHSRNSSGRAGHRRRSSARSSLDKLQSRRSSVTDGVSRNQSRETSRNASLESLESQDAVGAVGAARNAHRDRGRRRSVGAPTDSGLYGSDPLSNSLRRSVAIATAAAAAAGASARDGEHEQPRSPSFKPNPFELRGLARPELDACEEVDFDDDESNYLKQASGRASSINQQGQTHERTSHSRRGSLAAAGIFPDISGDGHSLASSRARRLTIPDTDIASEVQQHKLASSMARHNINNNNNNAVPQLIVSGSAGTIQQQWKSSDIVLPDINHLPGASGSSKSSQSSDSSSNSARSSRSSQRSAGSEQSANQDASENASVNNDASEQVRADQAKKSRTRKRQPAGETVRRLVPLKMDELIEMDGLRIKPALHAPHYFWRKLEKINA